MFDVRIVLIILCPALFVNIITPYSFASGSQENEQPPVTWQIFKSRDNMFTVQYPSNWTPSAIAEAERVGPIHIVFLAPISDEDQTGEIEFIQYAEPSVFRTSQESLQSEMNSLRNDPTVTKFEIERPIECQKYTLNGLKACSYIYEIATPEGSLAIMTIDALAPSGTEYEVYYKASFDLFEHLLPAAENMIRSFQITGENTTSDFALSDRGSGSNETIPNTNTTPDTPNNEDFSLN